MLTDIILKLHHRGFQIHAQLSRGTSHLKVSGTYVNECEALSCTLFYSKIFTMVIEHSTGNYLPIMGGWLSEAQMNWTKI